MLVGQKWLPGIFFDLISEGDRMQHIQNSTLQKTTLISFVEKSGDRCFTSKCLGSNVNGNRLKRESKATVIHQYPYEFIYPNAGLCWIQKNMSCDYFERL